MFRLADDRCPTCRKPRTVCSVQEGMERLTPEAAQTRNQALATAEMERPGAPRVVFFPIQISGELDGGVGDDTEQGNRLRITVRQMMADGGVRNAIAALVNSDRMPMSQFLGAVAELRRSMQ